MNGHSSGVWLTASASLLWGTVFVAANVGLQYANAYVLVFLRFLSASALIVALSLLFDRRLGVARALRGGPIWLLGLVDAIGFLLQYVGQDLSNASDATLLANLAPILVPIVAWKFCKEGISRAQIAAMLLGFSGLVLIAVPGSRYLPESFLGDILLFGASVCFALFIVLSKRFSVVSVGSALAIIVTITVFLAPIAMLLGKLTLQSLGVGGMCWYASIYMGVVCTVIPMVLYLRGLSSITSSESGTLLLLEVLSGLILAVSLLGQILKPYELLAGGVIVTALVIGVIFK